MSEGCNYMNARFSVAMNSQLEPKCKCGKVVKVGYQTKEGIKCSECYHKKETES